MIKVRLLRLLEKSGRYIGWQVFWQWISLVTQIVLVFSITDLIQMVYEEKEILSSGGRIRILAMFIAIAIRILCDNMAAKASYMASVDVKRVLRDKIYAKVLRLGRNYYEKMATSEIVQLSTEGVEQLEVYFGKYLPQLFYSLLAPITLFVVLSVLASRKASIVLLICVPLIPVSIVLVQKIAGKLLKKYWGSYTKLGDSFLESLQGMTTLKIYQADEKKAEEMDEEAIHFRKITMKVLTMQLNSTSVMDIIAYGGAAIGMIVAVWEFLQGRILLSQALCVILLASEFFIPLRLLGSFFHIAMNGMAASDKIFSLLDLPEPEKGRIERWKGSELQVQKLNFSYTPEREILHDIDLDLKPGAFISIVGSSGCGKSTLASLLAGKYENYEGRILFGGVEAKDLSMKEMVNHVTVIKHDSYLFSGTIRDNLLFAAPQASDKAMWEVLEKVNLKEFAEEKQGLQTKVLDGGKNLSGGQRQRLALARALLHDTEIYIFDEATSNIDAESEAMILDVIHKIAGEKTVFLISHRLFNVIDSDCILMMEQGRIVEMGTHAQLMHGEGAYKKLYESQRKLEEYGNKKEDTPDGEETKKCDFDYGTVDGVC